jgi:DNA-binding transcriptional regulator YiaG
MAVEATVRLTVNLLLSVAAIAALIQLLPYQTSQQVKLKELNATVKAARERVETSQKKFSHYFDPAQVRTVMQEQTNRIDAHKYPVLFQEPAAKPQAQ